MELIVLALFSPLTFDNVIEVYDRILKYNPTVISAVSVPSNTNSSILSELIGDQENR